MTRVRIGDGVPVELRDILLSHVGFSQRRRILSLEFLVFPTRVEPLWKLVTPFSHIPPTCTIYTSCLMLLPKDLDGLIIC